MTTQTGREPEAPEPVWPGEHPGRPSAWADAADYWRARAERAEAELRAEKALGQAFEDEAESTSAALERYRTTYRDAAQAHHEWAADPIYGCEHCARVTAALRDVYDFLKSHGYRTSIVDAALASIPQGEAEMCPCGFGEPHLSERARALREASEGTP